MDIYDEEETHVRYINIKKVIYFDKKFFMQTPEDLFTHSENTYVLTDIEGLNISKITKTETGYKLLSDKKYYIYNILNVKETRL